MPLIPCSSISIPPRQRKKVERSAIQTMKDSIAHPDVGLMTPIVVMGLGNSQYQLIAGFRRLTSVVELHNENRPIKWTIGPLEAGKIPATIIDSRSLPALLQMEFDENDIREELTWQERVAAISEIAAARKTVNPAATQVDLARETFDKMGGEAASPQSVGAINYEISQALAVAAVLAERPDLQKASSSHQAYQILLKERSEAFESELIRRRLLKTSGLKLWDIRHGDLRNILPTLPEGDVDLILVDPPYGQDIHKEDFAAGTIHRYDDSESYAMELAIFIIQEGWRLTKAKANLFMFCAAEHFPTLKTAAAQYGWTPWFHRIIWQKGEGTGHSPWGHLGFRHDYECLFWATKGQRGIQGPLSDVLDDPKFSKVGSRAKVHGAEKPVELLKFLIEKSTRPHDLVLDPCVGSGSTALAAASLKRRVIGIEMDETYFNRAMTRMVGGDDIELSPGLASGQQWNVPTHGEGD